MPSFIDYLSHDFAKRPAQLLAASFERAHIQFHDRSAICTAALALSSRDTPCPIRPRSRARTHQERRLFLKSMFSSYGILVSSRPPKRDASPSRKLFRFERIHEETYRNYGFEIVSIEPGAYQIAWQ